MIENSRWIGQRLGPYDVLAKIGEGGMGEVYRARDTKLGRDVALKILPESFAADQERLARFEREAQVLASLNHPNIATIHGIEEANGARALVLELVNGDTLADRIARGPIPLDEALPIASQIAEALEAAHDHGIVHRDLKPANIKVRDDGTVKVLDFGLAKLAESSAGRSNTTMSPTITGPALVTGVGVLLGTAAYMSPEQARGKVADRRSDLWAFGCVLHEMLAGKRAFDGEDVGDTLANVLKTEPDFKSLPASTPSSIRRLLRRTLEKDRKHRLADAAGARLEIEDARERSADDVPVGSDKSRVRERFGWVGAMILVIAAAAATLVWAMRGKSSPPELRVEITTPPTLDPVSFDISPDGRRIVFAATSESRTLLWIRTLDSVTPQPLAGTENGTLPFWSADGRSIGFFAADRLKRVDPERGTVQTLANVVRPAGGTWNQNGVILFSPNRASPILRVSAAGGQVSAVTPGTDSDLFPQFLPDGRHFLYLVVRRTGNQGRGVFIGDLEGGNPRHLLEADADSPGVYASGYLFFRRQRILFAQPFDAARLSLSGSPVPLAEPVVSVRSASGGEAGLAAIAYRGGTAGASLRQLVWFDRSGKELARLGDTYRADSGVPSMSPDGRQVVLGRVAENGGASDLWLVDTARGLFTRFTSDPFINNFAVWSPDGSRIVFQSNPNGVLDLYARPLTGSGPQELLVSSMQTKMPSDWSPDGKWLLYRSSDAKSGLDIWVASMENERKTLPVVQTSYDERDGQFSPDGKWIAYTSDESGRDEIYVQPFPGPGLKQRISTAGGTQARWRRDGKELFYLGLDEHLMAVSIGLEPDRRTVTASEPNRLFEIHVRAPIQRVGLAGELVRQQYIVSPDGQRFLVNTALEEVTTSPITLILNWAGVEK